MKLNRNELNEIGDLLALDIEAAESPNHEGHHAHYGHHLDDADFMGKRHKEARRFDDGTSVKQRRRK